MENIINMSMETWITTCIVSGVAYFVMCGILDFIARPNCGQYRLAQWTTYSTTLFLLIPYVNLLFVFFMLIIGIRYSMAIHIYKKYYISEKYLGPIVVCPPHMFEFITRDEEARRAIGEHGTILDQVSLMVAPDLFSELCSK